MKIGKKALLTVGAFVVVAAGATPILTHAAATVIHPHNENTGPTLLGNTNALVSGFISKDKAIEQAHIPQDAKLASAILTTWGQHVHEDLQDQGATTEIAKDRMVWVVKADYPNGTETKGGTYANATKTFTFDAATGRLLNVITTGDLISSHGPGHN